jgi:hypothetical protein
MKTNFFIASFMVLIINSAFTSTSGKISSNQPLPQIKQAAISSFDFFRTHRQGKAGITATWGFTATAGVTGFALERTYDDPTDPYAVWETVTMAPYTGARSYKFTENNIFPGFISYRVTSIMTNGDEVLSEISTVHIVKH